MSENSMKTQARGKSSFWNGDQFRDATKKIIGNAAKLREALKSLIDIAEEDCIVRKLELGDLDVSVEKRRRIIANAKAALAAPPRNCDMFATAEEALEEFNRVYFGPTEPEFVGEAFIRWLFAPAEGGGE